MAGLRRALVLCGLLFAVAPPASASAVARTGPFFGVSPQDGLTARDYTRMDGVVGTIRIPIFWMDCEPRRGAYDFADLDAVVGHAADAGVRVLPFVYGSPGWLASDPSRPPLARPARVAWARFLRALVVRYGPRGEFWRGRAAREPIRRWQIWNEPNFPLFWAPRPSPRGYARLLGTASRAIRADDPGADIVLAGLAPIEHQPPPWEFLRRLYGIPGFAGSFDTVALHPYSSTPSSLRRQIEATRAVMAAAGDRSAPLEITEFGVASGGSLPSSMVKGPEGQAAFLRRSFALLLENRRRWRLAGADWFTWRDWPLADPNCVFCQGAGLFDQRDAPKPAWWAFKKVTMAAAAQAVR